MRRLLYLLIPLALVAAACGGDNHDMDSMGPDPSQTEPGACHNEHESNRPVPDGARTIEVRATSFAFDRQTIELEAGEAIAINLTSEDAEHDFVIEDTELHVVSAAKGESGTGGFIAPAAGEYRFYCSVAGHRAAGMEGTLVVS